jgi:hypothetical protein
MAEKSGLEMIEDIMKKVDLLERRFTNIEQMMKEMLNRANGFEGPRKPSMCATAAQPRPSMMPTGIPPQKIGDAPVVELPEEEGQEVMLGPENIARKEIQIGDTPPGVVTGAKTKVMGKIKDTDGRFVSGVNVKVSDANGQVVKETRTNRAGDWMCFLPPGQYGAEYYLKDMIHANVRFHLEEGQTVFRVAQPQQ